MSKNILILGQQHLDQLRDGIAVLKNSPHTLTIIEPGDETAWREALPRADAVVWQAWHPQKIPIDLLLKAPKLKVLAGTFDLRFDPSDLSQSGIAVIDTSRSMTPSVAEFAVLLTLNLLRDAPAAIEGMKHGRWENVNWPDKQNMVYGDLTGRRVGLAGFGSINRRFSELIRGFECIVTTFDPHVASDELNKRGINRSSSLVALAKQSEIFVVGIPPLPNTRRIIDREVIQALPRGAILILVTRMAVVDQEALWERVQAGELSVGSDVFDPEPPPVGSWLLHHPNVLASPHMAGGAAFCHRRCFTTACLDTLAVLEGQTPLYQVNQRDVTIYQPESTQS